jgi:hypothetical protein
MTRIEALAIAAPLVAAAAVGLFVLATNYLDDKATARRLRQKTFETRREKADSVVSPTFDVFADAVENAGVIVEEGSRQMHAAAASQRTVESEKR